MGVGRNCQYWSGRSIAHKITIFIARSCCGPKQLLAGQGPVGRAGACRLEGGPGMGVGRNLARRSITRREGLEWV
jgi:hypothetical protein